MRDISIQSSNQGATVGYRSVLVGGRQIHPHNKEPEY